MIPLTVTREELGLARSWVEEAIAAETRAMRKKPEVTIGTMIETPRAAVCADEIAEEADFFSFGTNDLTQMTFGFSRDDVEGRMMSAYLRGGPARSATRSRPSTRPVSVSWWPTPSTGVGPPGPT